MEYVVVEYPDDREVCVDGQVAGQANDTLMIERGHHEFDLGDPKDYQPASLEINVQDTTPVGPLIIRNFQPIGAGE